MNELIKVANQNGKLVVSSREVAENFEKRHDHVIRDIDILIDSMGSPQNWGNLFISTEYTHDQNNQRYREYLLTRDGFTLLAMGFTGKKALEWKLKYIDAFNKMEASLRQTIPTMSQAELTAMIAQNQVAIEKTANMALEVANRADKQINNALDVFASPPDKEWRQSMNSRLRGMCQQYGLNYPVFF
ncbi:MAG TPA: Rha family transcriptional regulator, partial [Bacteroidales bacterium]|nr:Rha family transcriptional regulator [Bacteroidales bacterium]